MLSTLDLALNFKYLPFLFLFFSCGVKKPPIPNNKLPSVVERYQSVEKVKKEKKDKEKK